MPVRVMGLDFPNPVGLAAGLDKNGEHIDALATLGFGFIEVGTVTPRPQPGNPQPRLFRLPQAHALINRMGFNNLGIDRLVHNVGRARYRGILGINIGKNFDTPIDKRRSRLSGLHAQSVSARELSHGQHLLTQHQEPAPAAGGRRAAADCSRRSSTSSRSLAERHQRYVPLAVKIAPDLSDEQLAAIAQILLEQSIDAVIATNTTVSRVGVEGLPNAGEAGGLSGAPVRERSTAIVRALSAQLGGRIPIIAAGGILRAQDAVEKFAAGASLVQLYTGLIYRGPPLIA